MFDKRDKVVYFHIAKEDFEIGGKSFRKGQVAYVGSGNEVRLKSKANRSTQHLEVWSKLDFIIMLQGLLAKESVKFEQKMIHKYWDAGLLNKNKNVDNKKDYIYEELDKIFYLDDNLELRWKVGESCKNGTIRTSRIGTKAGGLISGYMSVSIDRVSYQVHRIVWVLHNKQDAHHNAVVDHIDRNRVNNHPSNLRLVSYTENQLNKTMKNKSTGIPNIAYYAKRFVFIVAMQKKNPDGTLTRVCKEFPMRTLINNGVSIEEAYAIKLKEALDYKEQFSLK